MIGSDFKVVYDATRNDSPLHLAQRGVGPVALCKVSLTPEGNFRTKQGVGETPSADCPTCLVRHAITIARLAHPDSQIDKDGKPKVEHVKEVAKLVEGDDMAVVVALLHDTIEDSSMTLRYLLMEHFPLVAVQAVELLTRTAPYDYPPYVARIAAAPDEPGRLSRMVKLADTWQHLGRCEVGSDRWIRCVGTLEVLGDRMFQLGELTEDELDEVKQAVTV